MPPAISTSLTTVASAAIQALSSYPPAVPSITGSEAEASLVVVASAATPKISSLCLPQQLATRQPPLSLFLQSSIPLNTSRETFQQRYATSLQQQRQDHSPAVSVAQEADDEEKPDVALARHARDERKVETLCGQSVAESTPASTASIYCS